MDSDWEGHDLLNSLGLIYLENQISWGTWIKGETSRWQVAKSRKNFQEEFKQGKGYMAVVIRTSLRHWDNKIGGTCILIGYGWKGAWKPLRVISEVLFSRTWYMVCHKHNGEMLLNGTEFSNFTQNVYISSNID